MALQQERDWLGWGEGEVGGGLGRAISPEATKTTHQCCSSVKVLGPNQVFVSEINSNCSIHCLRKKAESYPPPPPPPPPPTHTNPKNKTITNNKQNHSVHISPFNQYETSNYSTEKMVCKMSVLTTMTRWGTGFQSNGRQ